MTLKALTNPRGVGKSGERARVMLASGKGQRGEGTRERERGERERERDKRVRREGWDLFVVTSYFNTFFYTNETTNVHTRL